MDTFDIRTDRDALLEQAAKDAKRVMQDPDDQAEMLAILQFMGVADSDYGCSSA